MIKDWFNKEKWVCYFYGHRFVVIKVWGFPGQKCLRCGWCEMSDKSTLIIKRK